MPRGFHISLRWFSRSFHYPIISESSRRLPKLLKVAPGVLIPLADLSLKAQGPPSKVEPSDFRVPKDKIKLAPPQICFLTQGRPIFCFAARG